MLPYLQAHYCAELLNVNGYKWKECKRNVPQKNSRKRTCTVLVYSEYSVNSIFHIPIALEHVNIFFRINTRIWTLIEYYMHVNKVNVITCCSLYTKTHTYSIFRHPGMAWHLQLNFKYGTTNSFDVDIFKITLFKINIRRKINIV